MSNSVAAGKQRGLTSAHHRWTASTVKPATLGIRADPHPAAGVVAVRGRVAASASSLLLARTQITGWPSAPKAPTAWLRQR